MPANIEDRPAKFLKMVKNHYEGLPAEYLDNPYSSAKLACLAVAWYFGETDDATANAARASEMFLLEGHSPAASQMPFRNGDQTALNDSSMRKKLQTTAARAAELLREIDTNPDNWWREDSDEVSEASGEIETPFLDMDELEPADRLRSTLAELANSRVLDPNFAIALLTIFDDSIKVAEDKQKLLATLQKSARGQLSKLVGSRQCDYPIISRTVGSVSNAQVPISLRDQATLAATHTTDAESADVYRSLQGKVVKELQELFSPQYSNLGHTRRRSRRRYRVR